MIKRAIQPLGMEVEEIISDLDNHRQVSHKREEHSHYMPSKMKDLEPHFSMYLGEL